MYSNRTSYAITNQPDLRDAFWAMYSGGRKGNQTQNKYNATVRTAWNNFVDMMQKNGDISEALASRATL